MVNSATGNGSRRARFGPFEVDLRTLELWKFQTRLRLVGQPFSILAVLLRQPGELVTREELRNLLWPSDTFVDFNHGLNAAMNKLRETLGDSASDPRFIETLPRRGYRFIAKVEWLPAVPASLEQPEVIAEQISAPALQDLPKLEPPRRPTVWLRYAIAAGTLAVLIGFGYARLYRQPSRASSNGEVKTRPLVTDALDPALSPDGNAVAFVRREDLAGASGIFVNTIDSSKSQQLTGNNEDCCPVWSPDGRQVAFARSNGQVFVVDSPPAPPAEHRLNIPGISPRHSEIDWSPDGKSIAYANKDGIAVVSLQNSAPRQISHSPDLAEDWGPAFSPDGEQILFARSRQIGSPDELWIADMSGGDPTRVLSEPGRLASVPHWSADGRSVLYASNRTGHPALYRASLDSPNSQSQFGEAGAAAWDPTVSRRGDRLAYVRIIRSLSIWHLNLSAAGATRPRILISATSDTDQGPGPQFSPDGKKLAYMSDRSGTMEIWVSDSDGANPVRLTSVGGAGTPRWSPDSQSLVFDSNTPSAKTIAVVNVHGGPPRILLPASFPAVCPNWSRDGKWILFASAQTGDYQVWKVPVAGGTPLQLTYHGGHAAWDSPDGKTIYYAKTSAQEPEVWRIAADGGEETPVPLVSPGTWASWMVVNQGILFVGPSLGHSAVLSFFNFATRRATSLAVLDRTPFWLGATLDGRTVAFDQPGQEQAQAMLVENFH